MAHEGVVGHEDLTKILAVAENMTEQDIVES